MTDVAAGSKRSWDGEDSSSRKRYRDREEPRDWRDVHLRSSESQSRKSSSNLRPDSRYRSGDHGRYRRDEKRSPSYRERKPDSHRPRQTSRPLTPRRDDSEKEEGEISPPHSWSPPPSQPAALIKELTPPPQEPLPEMDLDILNETVEDALAARRARRQAILAKYTTPGGSSGVNSAVLPPPNDNTVSDPVSVSQPPSIPDTNRAHINGDRVSTSPDPEDFALAKDGDAEDGKIRVQAADGTGEQVSAADYDPSLDRREDEKKRFLADDPQEYEEVEEEDDVDDMFAVNVTDKKIKKLRKMVKSAAPALITTTLDSAADPEGYYSIILGEQLDGGRYQVFSSVGKGMFANVVRARILQGDVGEIGKEVAIKIIRCQESMTRAGQKEVQMLNRLRQADPDDRKHVIRLERSFEHRGHLCLVFEPMSMNLRDVIKRFGKDVGLNIRAVRAYSHQLFLALSLLRKTNVMHADIKPDNILVNEQKTVLKLCDLGSASDASENDVTPYLVSRFYRAPEIIMGVPYDPSLDVWSVGCTLYELYTGKILFPGRSNNQMLLLMMELKGRFNTKMIKKAKFGDIYFDDMGNFESIEIDRVTGADVVRKVHVSKPTKDLRARLLPPASVRMSDDESKMLVSFIDLLDKCLALDSSRRITPREALSHPFIRGG